MGPKKPPKPIPLPSRSKKPKKQEDEEAARRGDDSDSNNNTKDSPLLKKATKEDSRPSPLLRKEQEMEMKTSPLMRGDEEELQTNEVQSSPLTTANSSSSSSKSETASVEREKNATNDDSSEASSVKTTESSSVSSKQPSPGQDKDSQKGNVKYLSPLYWEGSKTSPPPKETPKMTSSSDKNTSKGSSKPLNSNSSNQASSTSPDIDHEELITAAAEDDSIANTSHRSNETDPAKSSRKYLSPLYWESGKTQTPDPNTDPHPEDGPQDQTARAEAASSNMYHSTHFGVEWTYATLLLHSVQFIFLLYLGFDALSTAAIAVMFLLIVSVAGLLLAARFCTGKQPRSLDWSYHSIKSPSQETDEVPNRVIYLLSLAALLEGGAYALYPVSSAGRDSDVINDTGFKSYQTMTQVLGFASIVNFGFNRILRPANRLDPLRSVLEVEIIGICWDALDGATLYQLLVTTAGMSASMDFAVRFLMSFWYVSVGVRLAMMYAVHLSPDSKIYQTLFPPAMSWSDEPTVDRTLGGIALKSSITLAMAFSQFYAAALRLCLMWRGKLDTVQQEMMVKNFLFLAPAGGAVVKYYQMKGRYWNTRKILQAKIPYLNLFINLQKPSRSFQLEVLRYTFCCTYLIVGIMFSVFLTQVTGNVSWLANIATDVVCIAIFFGICREIHSPDVWIIFPKRVAFALSILLGSNLYLARLIGIYSNSGKMEDTEEDHWNYTNAMLVVLFSIIPISTYALFWSVCNMLFHREFTACPGNYNAVHDPGITLVSVQTMLEGALDIVSCAALLALAPEADLPVGVDVCIVFFAFMEIVNSCQCFVLQVMLSGGHDDTPAHFVQLRSKLRMGRGFIDLGTFSLRLVLWLQYDAVASVFMIKNLFNLLHTVALVERSKGVDNYSPDTLFMSYVRPRDWYGMSKEEWRRATRESIGQQAQAGRAV